MGLRGVRPRVAVQESEWRRWPVLAAVVAGGWLLALPGPARANSGDRVATHTFLQASYTLDSTLVANAARTKAAAVGAGATIAAECPKVLAGAPGGPTSLFASGALKQPSPRARGEADRQQRQYSNLTGELESAVRSAAFQIDGPALATFAATVTPLRWSKPAIASAVASELSLVRAIFESGPLPAVCADMRAWVLSGYRTLSAGSRTYLIQQEDLITALRPLGGSPEALMKPFEGPSERAILRRREALPDRELLELGGPATTKLHQELGIEEETGSDTSTLSKSKVFGHGRTHDGTPFDVEENKGFGPHCRYIISFSETRPSEGGTTTSSVGDSLRCLSGGKPAPRASVGCEEGTLHVESTTLARTRRVRLLLSDGRTVLSRVTLVPRRYGGPAGVYFQALRGPSPYPVALSELDARGRLVRSVPLRAVRGCRRLRATNKPVFRTILEARTPGGQPFSITGLSVADHARRSLQFSAEGANFTSPDTELRPAKPTAATRTFSTQLALGCEPHPFAVLYGQLRSPGATVLAATASTPLTPLTEVAIPKALRARGVLAYIVLDGLPTEVVVRSAAGTVIFREDRTALSKSDGEFCEGYAETAS